MISSSLNESAYGGAAYVQGSSKKTYGLEGQPPPETTVRFSTRGYLINGGITNIPLYFAGRMFELI